MEYQYDMRSKADFNHGSCSLSSVDCKISKSKMMGGGGGGGVFLLK